MKTSLRSLFALLSSLAFAALAVAQAPSLAPGANMTKDGKKYVAYKITRGDILSVAVLNEPDLIAGGKRVESVGTINLQLIGDIRVVGLTQTEAAEAIANAYREQRFLRNPSVNVNVETHAPRSVRVNGKVNSQGTVNIPPDVEWTIIDVIIKANGLAETAKGSAVRVFRTLPDGSPKYFELDVETVLKAKTKNTNAPAATFVVEPDDIIFVPEKII